MASEALDKAKEDKERALGTLRRIKSDHANAIRETVGAGITIGSAFGVGWFEARYPKNADIVGMPVSLVLGGALLTAAAFEVGGKEESKWIGDAGRGCLAAWAAGRGGEMGREQLAKAA